MFIYFHFIASMEKTTFYETNGSPLNIIQDFISNDLLLFLCFI